MEVDSTTESNSQAPNFPPSDCSSHSAAGDFVAVPLSAQTSISTVPATPDADTPPSKFASFRQGYTQNGKLMATKGTPFVGARHGAQRPVLPGTVSRVGHGTPFRNNYLAFTPGVPASYGDRNFNGSKKRPADDLDCLDDDDDDDERVEFEQHEALLFLEIARARSDVRKLEQKLAQAKCKEINTTGKLYKLQAEEANRRMDAAETKVGVIRNSIRMTGGSLVDMSVQKRRRIATDDSIRIGPGLPSGSPEV